METALTTDRQITPELMEKALLGDDLSGLTPTERLSLYKAVCHSLGLNPLTKPFGYHELDHKLVLYARKDCTDQLRSRESNPVDITIVKREETESLLLVTAQAVMMNTGRKDESIGAVPKIKEEGEWRTSQNNKRFFHGLGTYKPLNPLELANAMMKCETKAKRRVTLSICGLGILDESEIEDIPPAPEVVPSGYANKRDAANKIAEIMKEGLPPQEQFPPKGVSENLKDVLARGAAEADTPIDEIEQEINQHRAHISTAHTTKQAKERLELVPEALRQECYTVYVDTCKRLGKK